MAQDTWAGRERPLLEAIAAGEAEHVRDVNTEWMIDRTGLTPEDVAAGLAALLDAEYIDAIDAGGGDDVSFYLRLKLRERGRRDVGTWPSEDSFTGLLDALDVAAENATDEETTSRLRRARDAVAGIGREVGTQVLTAWLKAQAGL